MGNAWLNGSVMIYIEKAMYASMDDEVFQPLTLNPGCATANLHSLHSNSPSLLSQSQTAPLSTIIIFCINY